MSATANGVLVIADGGRQPLSTTTREMLALGRRLTAGQGGSVGLLVFGRAPAEVAVAAGASGADRVYGAPGSDVAGYHPETFAALAAASVRPALMTMIGLVKATSRAADKNERGSPMDSM